MKKSVFKKIDEFEDSDSDESMNNKKNELDLMEPESEFDKMFNEFHFPSFNNQFKEFFDNKHNESEGTCISKSYVSSTKYNEKGEPETETYQNQSIKHMDKDGHKIHEKQEAYKNSLNGVEKVSHQKTLDGKGHKIIQERNKKTGQKSQHEIFRKLKKEDLNEFNKQYDEYRKKTNFNKNYEFLGKLNKGNFLGNNNNSKHLPSAN